MTEQLDEKLELLQEGLLKLPDRERAIICGRFGLNDGKPLTLEKLGAMHGVQRERIRQIQNVALSRLRRFIEDGQKDLRYPDVASLLIARSERGGPKIEYHVPTPERAAEIRQANKERLVKSKVERARRRYVRYADWVDNAIEALEAWKKGHTIQMRGRFSTSGQWIDFDLCEAIDQGGMIEWRAKPEFDSAIRMT